MTLIDDENNDAKHTTYDINVGILLFIDKFCSVLFFFKEKKNKHLTSETWGNEIIQLVFKFFFC